MAEQRYQVSVVTPFHNVNIGMFKYAYESLKKQTLGFENIQWIVVLHNTESKYKSAVHELLDNHENIILKELDNDIHTPSSPRNLGMKFATAPYLGFLDADDGYTPECLETAIKHLKKTNSDIVVFRREYEMEREGLMPATEIVLWDQTQEEIIMDREHWDDEKMFGGLFWGMVTSRLYSRDFIARYGFTFDETVPFTEDVLFLIELYGKAQRVCYLPQLIGYHYFINSDSLVQSMVKKSGETLVSYAAGFKKIFEAAFKNGIYIDELMAMLLATYAIVMIQTKNLSLANRKEIKEILEPYVHQIRMLPTSKLVSPEKSKTYYSLPRDVILHPENFDKGNTVKTIRDGQEILMDILEKNKDTDYGRRYHFSNLRTMEGYQARVPISHYSTYAPLVKLQTRIGESGIFTSSQIPCYLLSSDSLGEPRLIPATQEHLKPYCDEFSNLVRERVTFLLGESLPKQRKYNDQAALNSLFGWVISDFCHQEQLGLGANNARFTAPTELLFPPKAMGTIYLRLLFALKERDVDQIVAPFTWGVLEAFTFLERFWRELCNDIEQGKITFILDIPDEFLARMDIHLSPDPTRAQELRDIFEQGFENPVAALIWPKLNRVVATGTGSFTIYTKLLSKYIGNLTHDNGLLVTSVGILGKSIIGSNSYELATGESFYEFRPLVAAKDTRPLFTSELQEGESYEIIITNRAGLYRFATKHIIKVDKWENGKIIFSHIGLLQDAIPFDECLLWEQDIYLAIQAAAEVNGITLFDFSYYLQDEDCGARLQLLLEVDNKKDELAPEIDQRLCDASKAYASARKKELSPCAVSYLAPESHMLYRDVQRFKHQTAPDQIKPTHFLNNKEKIQFFTAVLE